MSKPDLAEWCDYVRGVGDPQRKERLSELLASGPAAARDTIAAFSQVLATARADQLQEPPAYALRCAYSLSSTRPSGRRESGFTDRAFQVVFDSLRDALPAGSRRLHSAHRQLVIESAEIQLDLKIERETDPGQTVVVGQVIDRQDGDPRPLRQVPVLLFSATRVVGRALSGPFGEFQADGLREDPVSLCLLISDDERLRVPLDEAFE